MRIFESACSGGSLCGLCRKKEAGRPHRKNWRKAFEGMPEGDDFECPSGKPWIDEADHREPEKLSIESISQILKEWGTGKMVSEEVSRDRKEICNSCEYLKNSDAGKYCSAKKGCGCTVEPRKVAFLKVGWADITRWEEKPGKKLCAHPKRGNKSGKGWPM